MSDVAPPDTAVWYDPEATVAAVLAVLRLSDGDVDQARIEQLVPAAGLDIANAIDSPTPIDGPPPAENLQTALVERTVVLYRGHGTVGDSWVGLQRERAGQSAVDALGVDSSLVRASKVRWGIG